MSRAFTRALVLSTIGGLAIAPALAYAADGAPAPHAPTVTRVHAPKSAHGGEDFLLSARVSIATQPSAPTKDQGPDQQGSKGKGKKGKSKKGKGHRHAAETGSITFVVDGKSLPPVKISHGRALEKLTLPAGSHTATASYSGDSHYDASQSTPVTFTVS
ncbi:MAG TPA: Ig-like domain-containing protein [Actinocrinis sp.]|uniref:Ig-like domain-containing protein n=1 Tax=Actinocrinis sp. TaxID=1920516 RepID=UPI002DDD3219|nr:Ig-like domain-containing protein [Actinocrinis sp.]HEV2344451.1 Ig-like domain-containing protein [Actinocrinis sp.]